MIRRPPRSTQSRSSAASDVYKRQPTPGSSSASASASVIAPIVQFHWVGNLADVRCHGLLEGPSGGGNTVDHPSHHCVRLWIAVERLVTTGGGTDPHQFNCGGHLCHGLKMFC